MNKNLVITFLLLILGFTGYTQDSNQKEASGKEDRIKYSKLRRLVKKNNLIQIKELISIGLSSCELDDILYCASDFGNYQMAMLVIQKGANANKQYDNKAAAILISTGSENGNILVTELLLENGANVNMLGTFGETALRSSVFDHDYPLFKLLIENGADINFKCGECCDGTPLLYTCGNGTYEMAEYLISRVSSINQLNCKGENALMYAIGNDNSGIAKLLIDNNIDLTHVDDYGYTAEYYANYSKNYYIYILFNDIED